MTDMTDLTDSALYGSADGRPRSTFRFDVTESTGSQLDDYGYEYGTSCPGCDLRPAKGDEILRCGEKWWHLDCARKRMRDGGANTAWQMLAVDLAARPSRYTVTETRAIVRNVLRLIKETP